MEFNADPAFTPKDGQKTDWAKAQFALKPRKERRRIARAKRQPFTPFIRYVGYLSFSQARQQDPDLIYLSSFRRG